MKINVPLDDNRRYEMVGWCRLRDSNPRPTVYKTVALPTELNRRRATDGYQRGRAGARDRGTCFFAGQFATNVERQAPTTGVASSIPGQAGIVTARKQSGSFASARN